MYSSTQKIQQRTNNRQTDQKYKLNKADAVMQ